jgi:putative ABC transport system permease protein
MRDWTAFVREHFHGRRPPSGQMPGPSDQVPAASDQVIEELAQHVEETWRAARAAGRSEAEALAAARAQLENPPARLPRNMIAASESPGIGGTLATALRDVRYALRVLRARPGFAAVAVITLALGVGANTAIFSVVRSLLLEPLPFRDPDRLVMLWEADPKTPQRPYIVSAPNYLDWRRSVKAFAETGIWEYLNYNFSGDGEAERVPGLRVSASTFTMLGVSPQLGRTFTAEEDAPGHDVAIIGDGLWRRRFAGRPDIIGHTARINGKPFEIIGVMPASFRFPSPTTGVWTPIAFNEQDQERSSHSFQAGARLRDGVSTTSAMAELETVARALAVQYPDDNRDETATLTPMKELGIVPLRPTLIAVSGAVVLVLVIACVNVANLLLAHSSSRRQEFAVRSALGASRRRLAGQVVCEGLVIAVLGGIAGLGVAWGATQLLAGVLPPSIVYAPFRDASAGIQLDPWVLGFTAAISLATGLLFSLAPIAGLSRPGLKAGGDRASTGRLTILRSALVATEVALALIVLVAAGLMIKSLARLVSIDPGLDPSNVLVISMSVPQPDFYGPPVRQNFCTEVTDRVGSLPGVISTGAISHLPLSGANAGRGFTIEGRTLPPGENASASYRVTCPGYFKTLGIPMVKGRDFDARDATSAPGAVIINEETAKRYWPDGDPIGRRIKLGRQDSINPWMTVVGVVGNVRHFGLDDVARREMFRPYSQAAWPLMTIVTKTSANPTSFAASIRAALQKIDPDLPVARVNTMETIERDSLGSRRFPMMLLGAFGAVALALAVIGVYGVVSYVVARRTREIGIRVALGARRGQVLTLVVFGAMRPVVAGLAVGTVGAIFASRLLGTMLFDVKPGDPAVVAGIALMLAGAAIAASLVPGARATRVDPITVLKVE